VCSYVMPPLVWLIALVTPSLQQQAAIAVPRGRPPVIDGRIAAQEWNGSFEAVMPDGTELKLRRDDAYLYVAVHGTRPGFPSLCVTRGDTTRVLHASAALGDALFTGAGSSRRLVAPFAFEMRSAESGDALAVAQARYLVSHRWVATNNAMSTTDREMKVDLALFEPNDARLAIGFYTMATDSVSVWPAGANDGCTAAKVVQGWLPPAIEVRPRSWALLAMP
jgi:hypothetical protein